MTRKPITIAASLLAAAALAPATAAAADVALGGAPQLRIVDTHHATLKFASDRLDRDANGRIDARVTVSGERVRGLKATGRHGRDVVYTARLSTARDLRAGTKYTVRFAFPGQDAITRKVKLHPAG